MFVLTLMFVGCSGHQEMEDVTATRNAAPKIDQNVANLVEKVRHNDSKAYLELAECYREGIGVDKDFLNTVFMLFLAEDYGAIDDVENYVLNLSEDNYYGALFKLLDKPYYYERYQVDSIFNVATGIKKSDLQAMHGIMDIQFGDSVRGFEKLGLAAANGSSLGMLLSCFTDYKLISVSPEKLMAIAERVPIAYILLGNIYVGVIDSKEKIDRKRAAEYFLKADEFGLLTKRRALWLYNYIKDNSEIKISEQDLQRIRTLAMIDSEN